MTHTHFPATIRTFRRIFVNRQIPVAPRLHTGRCHSFREAAFFSKLLAFTSHQIAQHIDGPANEDQHGINKHHARLLSIALACRRLLSSALDCSRLLPTATDCNRLQPRFHFVLIIAQNENARQSLIRRGREPQCRRGAARGPDPCVSSWSRENKAPRAQT